MNVIYSKHYNINLGLQKYLHPFDGTRFQTVYEGLKGNQHVEFIEPSDPASMEAIDEFLCSTMQRQVRDRDCIFNAMEVPRIPFTSFAFLDRRILSPMRWGIAGTILGASRALQTGGTYWNLSGGYHHATQNTMEGFCIYNDVGICHQQLIKKGLLTPDDKILIIDTDAHHGNGNAETFMDNKRVTILDIYNTDIYPSTPHTRNRVDIPVSIPAETDGQTYLQRYREALLQLDDHYRLAFVVAGTDTLMRDKLGGLCLSIDDVAEREKLTLQALTQRSIPTVILGGGGYSADSAKSIIRAILVCAEQEQS